MLKGTFAVAVAALVLGRDAALCAAAGAFIGHLFPVWLGFKGGKGVATFIGLLLGFGAWIALLGFCVIWLGVAFASRYSSLAALIASAATPAILWAHGDRQLAALFLALAALLWIMHRANITRILNGTESKIGRKAEAA
jgi:glycerol-3-phosphate acyltransferase PlsY